MTIIIAIIVVAVVFYAGALLGPHRLFDIVVCKSIVRFEINYGACITEEYFSMRNGRFNKDVRRRMWAKDFFSLFFLS